MKARDIMTSEVVYVTPDDSVDTVARLLSERKISGVPVVDDTMRVVGVVSESDLMVRAQKLRLPFYLTLFDSIIFLENPLRFNEEMKKFTAARVRDLMTREPIVVDEDAEVADIAALMSESEINRVPVVREGKLVGIITRNDVVRSLVR
ncbi:MAG: CBS domain-containing protein [Syntrophomonadaceae bacterium]|jgi:CBS domain-containing protein|nr:CBS domain-containing protein [Syntrophomonadaceae bacterium]MDH7497838.1 CBS domain-containing protein [Syntrophomonadaceae bacterium]